jgi:TetR/AcrR family transcriptional regulator
MTQSYADFAPQMQLVLGRDQLTVEDFADAEELITKMVLGMVVGPA